MKENKIVKLATDKPLTLDCGKSLGPIQTAYTTYGSLNANNQYLIPSISPLVSSMVLMAFVGSFWLTEHPIIGSKELALKGGIILAFGTLIGALLQFLIHYFWHIFQFFWKHPGLMLLME
mgnify:CR=1 FL=1